MSYFEMTRGDDKRYQITVKDKLTGLPVNITGCTLTLTWRKTYTDVVFLTKTFSIIDAMNGIAQVTIMAADTNSLAAGVAKEFLFDVQITDGSSLIETIAKGKFRVLPDVTYT